MQRTAASPSLLREFSKIDRGDDGSCRRHVDTNFIVRLSVGGQVKQLWIWIRARLQTDRYCQSSHPSLHTCIVSVASCCTLRTTCRTARIPSATGWRPDRPCCRDSLPWLVCWAWPGCAARKKIPVKPPTSNDAPLCPSRRTNHRRQPSELRDLEVVS